MLNPINILQPDANSPPLRLPLYDTKISAGFPSPANEYVGDTLDLNEYLVNNKTATFFVQVEGDSMIQAGINEGDILVVDRSITPSHGRIVIARVDNEFTVKRLYMNNGIRLVAENKNYAPIVPNDLDELEIWGVVTAVVRKT